ncbi:GAP family protein [Nodosilinea sp. LEGE 06152]|uniref:GAP family protein n=1 Tax=Nodosilinea sp. LEGE 06152 TaxID=2777966 RepID=UPI00187F1567|nr:GAP family protein [Nodosilinea sp. LEGE 06152]MBE9156173.1 GAP family protein [Nodosilinea sp. LEGE 06152]
MESVIVSLLPYILGSALVPLQIIIGLLLLQSPDQGLLKGIAYVGGMTLTRLLQGVAFGLFLGESVAASAGNGGKGPVVATLLLVLGLLLLVTAYKKWRKQPDPDEPPPKWLTAIDSATPLQALGIGLTLPLIAVKLWVFTLSALSTIATAQLGLQAGAIAYLLFILLAQSLLLLPLALRLAIPQQSKAILDRASAWLTTYNRPIVIAVSLVFGLLFLQSGLSGLQSLPR